MGTETSDYVLGTFTLQRFNKQQLLQLFVIGKY